MNETREKNLEFTNSNSIFGKFNFKKEKSNAAGYAAEISFKTENHILFQMDAFLLLSMACALFTFNEFKNRFPTNEWKHGFRFKTVSLLLLLLFFPICFNVFSLDTHRHTKLTVDWCVQCKM